MNQKTIIEKRYDVVRNGFNKIADLFKFQVTCKHCNKVIVDSTTTPQHSISAHEIVTHKNDRIVNPHNIQSHWV